MTMSKAVIAPNLSRDGHCSRGIVVRALLIGSVVAYTNFDDTTFLCF